MAVHYVSTRTQNRAPLQLHRLPSCASRIAFTQSFTSTGRAFLLYQEREDYDQTSLNYHGYSTQYSSNSKTFVAERISCACQSRGRGLARSGPQVDKHLHRRAMKKLPVP